MRLAKLRRPRSRVQEDSDEAARILDARVSYVVYAVAHAGVCLSICSDPGTFLLFLFLAFLRFDLSMSLLPLAMLLAAALLLFLAAMLSLAIAISPPFFVSSIAASTILAHQLVSVLAFFSLSLSLSQFALLSLVS
jgi:hypothetical protein